MAKWIAQQNWSGLLESCRVISTKQLPSGVLYKGQRAVILLESVFLYRNETSYHATTLLAFWIELYATF